MTDTALLKQIIKDHGIRISFLAQKCGLSYQGLWKKINGFSEFRQSEIVALCQCLDIKTPDAVNAVFFADKVEKVPT